MAQHPELHLVPILSLSPAPGGNVPGIWVTQEQRQLKKISVHTWVKKNCGKAPSPRKQPGASPDGCGWYSRDHTGRDTQTKARRRIEANTLDRGRPPLKVMTPPGRLGRAEALQSPNDLTIPLNTQPGPNKDGPRVVFRLTIPAPYNTRRAI